MIGAAITHLFFQPPAALAIVPLVLGGLLALIAWGRWSERPVLARPRR